MNNKTIKWMTLTYDFNADKIVYFDIFDDSKFRDLVYTAINHFTSYDGFLDDLKKALFISFASKSEYEIMCKGILSNTNYKYDVYKQVLPNIEILAEYVLKEVGVEYER